MLAACLCAAKLFTSPPPQAGPPEGTTTGLLIELLDLLGLDQF